ncbi:arylsulfatase [Methanosarcina sp. 1.H.T.1A.1]|uniref:arylsulfatase n=1 Tax=Methanosarcina sp. 1.H.T.1A.1 TaxID=1483602 RepID=UPI0006228569|nr:arylsulfatase [Methanosarcina sp. 1.H.T.1A.1]KKI00009.1 arylsulfatase [Methanosarcina sp. 1.H.T.1A.1]
MSTQDEVQRSILPIPDMPHAGLTTYDARDPDTRFPPIKPLRPPKEAPNVLIILLDDVGFGASSAFGGPANTPTAERLANTGLKYNRFHTTALCAPTRAALLTGRNHHSVGMGSITEASTPAPGYNAMRPNNKAPLPEILRLNGYSTAQFGKCHEVPPWETSPMGPFDRWPTGSGFEYFYGFVGGETNQYYPAIYEGTTPVEQDRLPEEGYHFTEDMTNKAIKWIRQQKALMPDKPFFIYYAPGATHAPHHVPAEWSDKYRGKFDQGYEKLREEILARQKALGVVPPDCELTPWNKEVPHWEQIPDDMKPVLVRQMEVYAGFLEHTDYHIGRVIDALEDLEILDDTLIYYIIGDNGASAEGTFTGAFMELTFHNGRPDLEAPEIVKAHINDFGTPKAYNHYAAGWAMAMNTPYQWSKMVASHWGGTRNGTVVHWPRGIQAQGEIRNQFMHVIDIAPTVLEVAGIPEPTQVHGITQSPMEGVSLLYTFNDASAPECRETQYFEVSGNRGIYHKGWSAVTPHVASWRAHLPQVPFDEDVWELYGPDDWSQARDLAGEMPEELERLKLLWLIEATKYNVLPMDDRLERLNPDLAGRPQLVRGKSQLLFGGMGRLNEWSVISIKNKSHSVTADVTVPDSGAEGVIVAQGGMFGGWSLYAKDGRLKYCYNLLGHKTWFVESDQPVPVGQHQVRMEFAYDGGGIGKGGLATLFIDGKKVGSGRVEETHMMIFSTEDCDVGRETGSTVSPDYGPRGNKFSGEVNWVQIDLGLDDQDHLISPEERFSFAMARQ